MSLRDDIRAAISRTGADRYERPPAISFGSSPRVNDEALNLLHKEALALLREIRDGISTLVELQRRAAVLAEMKERNGGA